MQKLIISCAVALGLMVPAFALAQTSTTGLLNVYVQVLTQSGYSSFQTYAPGNVTVSVAGNAPSLTTFPGSQSGTPVQLYPGSYSVTANNLLGYAPSYSVGCNNTIAAGQSQTCVITMTPSYGYPYQYPNTNTYYPYSLPPLSCSPQVPSVALGQPVTFEAFGGVGGTYNWTAPYTQSLNYPNAGRSLTVSFEAQGAQTVTVTNASQTASCSVQVTNGYYPIAGTYPTYPYGNYPYGNSYGNNIYGNNPYNTNLYGNYPYSVSGPTYSADPSQSYYPSYPQLPRTGFGPHDRTTGMALAVVLLIAAGIATAPYARKAFAIVSR